MLPSRHFSADYAQARVKFLDQARAAGAELVAYPHPLPGPAGEPLATDVALIGDPSARRVLVLLSATHGVEGFCGSGAQIGWLAEGHSQKVPEDVRVVLIHAINPYGFAWLQRETNENVDLNRNCLPFDGTPLPDNPNYRALHPVILPARWDSTSADARRQAFAEFSAAHGAAALQLAVTGGQYSHADGLFYGGAAPTWSNTTLRRILRAHVRSADHVGMLDFHTGLGPYGTAQLIIWDRPGEPEHDRAEHWYRNGLASHQAGGSLSAPLTGTLRHLFSEELPDAELTRVVVEYGTYPLPHVLETLMGRLWLRSHGTHDYAPGREIIAAVRRAFYPDEDEWKELVWVRARQLINRAARGLWRSE